MSDSTYRIVHKHLVLFVEHDTLFAARVKIVFLVFDIIKIKLFLVFRMDGANSMDTGNSFLFYTK